MIIELQQQTDYNLNFIYKYIRKALNIGEDLVFSRVYPDESEFIELLPESLKDEEIELSLNIYFVDAATIKYLNKETRNIDEVTDVLSFPALDMYRGKFKKLHEYDFYPDEDNERYVLNIGELVICVERAIEQAKEYNHSNTRELSFLALHGFLHVLGFDHEASEEDEELMFGLQDEILDKANITRSLKDEADVDTDFRAGYIAIIGQPNAGKSTFLNRMAGDKLAITSPKAKTTRNNIKTVLDDGEHQLVFIDTPGISRTNNSLERYMTSSAWSALYMADVVLLLVDAKKGKITEVEKTAVKKAQELDIPIILLFTKIDSIDKRRLLPLIDEYSSKFDFADIIPISTFKDDNIDLVLDVIRKFLPRRNRIYSEDAYTDQSERALAAEYIREEILNLLYQEVPHDVAVHIEEFREEYNEKNERSLVVIEASILVNKSSQKGILIGKKGSMIKRIGSRARVRLEEIFDAKVYLDLYVKVAEDWKNEKAVLDDLGYVEGKNGPAEIDVID